MANAEDARMFREHLAQQTQRDLEDEEELERLRAAEVDTGYFLLYSSIKYASVYNTVKYLHSSQSKGCS